MSYEARFKDGPLKGEKLPMGKSLPSDLAVHMEKGKPTWYHDSPETELGNVEGGDVALYELGEVDGKTEVGTYYEVVFEPVLERRRVN